MTENLDDELNEEHHLLWEHFDDSAVQDCLLRLEQNADENIPVYVLMNGRGAAKIWNLLEEFLKRDPHLNKIAAVAHELPFREIATLVNEVAPTDNEIIESIMKGEHISGLYLLPKLRLDRIARSIEESFSSNSIEDAKLLRQIVDHAKFSRNKRILDLASAWCLERAKQRSIIPVLTELLSVRNDTRLISLAEELLQTCDWTREDTLLLVQLMRAQKKGINTQLIYDWMTCTDEDMELDPYVISMWFYHSGSREAFDQLRMGIEYRPQNFGITFWTLASYSGRKNVRRWTRRHLSKHIRFPLAHSILRYSFLSIAANNIKYAYRLAEQAVEYAEGEEKDDLVSSLVSYGRKTNKSEILLLARQLVDTYPNAPRSFTIMCSLAKTDPEFGIPWLFKWCETALPFQTMRGLQAILEASPSEAQRKQALEWQQTLVQKDLLPLEQKS